MLITLLALVDEPSDRERFIALYNENRDSMYSYALRILGDKWLAEDAVHDAFERVAINFSRIDFCRNTRNLLLTVVKNIALTMKKKLSREILISDADSKEAITDCGFEEEVETGCEIDRMAKLVSAMSEDYLIVFRLRCIHDLTYPQIASLLGITVAAAKKRMQRVREKIAEYRREG